MSFKRDQCHSHWRVVTGIMCSVTRSGNQTSVRSETCLRTKYTLQISLKRQLEVAQWLESCSVQSPGQKRSNPSSFFPPCLLETTLMKRIWTGCAVVCLSRGQQHSTVVTDDLWHWVIAKTALYSSVEARYNVALRARALSSSRSRTCRQPRSVYVKLLHQTG